MSQQAMEQLVGRMVLDKEFRAKFASSRDDALAGLDLTAEERASVAAMDLNEFNAGVSALDERISKGFNPIHV